MQLKEELYTAIRAAIEAGKKIIEIYNATYSIEYKDDKSPLTDADKASNAVICELLEGSYPIISEENRAIDYSERKSWEACWIIDPLDGTKEFIKRNGEFTVNIALVEKGIPIVGVVFVPVNRKLYFGAKGQGSFSVTVEAEHLPTYDQLVSQADKLPHSKPLDAYTIVASRSHINEDTEQFIEECRQKYGEVRLESCGSSLKLCMVAEGNADVYPRIAPTMEWDTAAAHAVAKYAGCEVVEFESKEELQYNKENLLNPFFVVGRKLRKS